MNRRTILKSTVTAPIAVTAGCTSSSNNGDTGGNGENKDTSQSDIGSTIETGGIELTLNDVRLAIEIEDIDGDVHTPEDGEMWVLVNVESINNSEETRDLPYAENFKLITGNRQYDIRSTTDLSKPVSGEEYEAPSDAREGVSVAGWMAFSVPDTTEEATLSWVGDGNYEDGEGEANWDLSLDPSELPDVGFRELNIPNSAEVGEEITAEVVLENAGGTEYTVESALNIEYPNGSTEVEPFKLNVPANDSANVQFSFNSLAIGSFTAALEDYNVSESVEVTPITATFGETVAVDGLPQITISEPTTAESVEYAPYYGDSETLNADGSFVLFEVEIQNTSSESSPVPEASEIELAANGTMHEALSLNGLSYLDPLNGEKYNPLFGIGAGETIEGIIRFDVPRSTSNKDLEVIAEWSLGYAEGDTSIHWSR